MSKQAVLQKYIFKIHSERLRKNKWDLTLPLKEARNNDEVISLADSQVLRWIDELNGTEDADGMAREIRSEIRRLKHEPNTIQNRHEIKRLYTALDELQFQPDYMCLIIDKEKDYWRACKGYKINGIEYQRLLGTNGGIKMSTIVFVSKRLHDEIARRIDNGRDMSKPLVPSKLEAYKALACSSSIPVSLPHGILVVDDFETEFNSDVIYLNDEDCDEPVMELRPKEHIVLDGCDGCGIMLPSLAERWSQEIGLDYVMSGCNTRFSFEKGMVFTFDFIDFAECVAEKYIVKDAWGKEVDIRDVELILTTSMVKLWDSYESCDDYINKSLMNHYTFGVPKVCPKELESERGLNYQFIQSYDLSDEDIDELIRPTIDQIKDVLGGDWRKALLFSRGSGMNEDNVERSANDFAKAIMADRRMIDDPYIKSIIYRLIKKRIDDAKVGVIQVHGNYSIVSGDPFALCQSIFGLRVTGLLGPGQIYNGYWKETDAEYLACFRAPMTCHNNIRKVFPVRNARAEYWYQYMKTCTIFNAWDTAAMALNGMDYDGDLVMLTDNKVLVNKIEEMPALMCVQRRAEKTVPTEEDTIKSNIASFGNDIGQTTNWITSMFEVQSRFEKGSDEYNSLAYRIRCGQLYQQNTIDKAKGIISKPMPKSWHDRHCANKVPEQSKTLYRNIVADRKPYFMIYIYPDLKHRYATYIKNTNRNAMIEFGMTVDELLEIPFVELTERQKEFLKYYEMKLPVATGKCVMNRICKRFEDEFDGYLSRHKDDSVFDYTIMKSSGDYTRYQFDLVKKLYNEFDKKIQSYVVFSKYERTENFETAANINIMRDEFKRDCLEICNNTKSLCNIILDICYTKSLTKKFAWDLCGDEIIENLLDNNGNVLMFPTLDEYGDIEFGGNTFSMSTYEIGAAD